MSNGGDSQGVPIYLTFFTDSFLHHTTLWYQTAFLLGSQLFVIKTLRSIVIAGTSKSRGSYRMIDLEICCYCPVTSGIGWSFSPHASQQNPVPSLLLILHQGTRVKYGMLQMQVTLLPQCRNLIALLFFLKAHFKYKMQTLLNQFLWNIMSKYTYLFFINFY